MILKHSIANLIEESKHHLLSIFVVSLTFLMNLLSFYFDIQNRIVHDINTSEMSVFLREITQPSMSEMILAGILGVVLSIEYFQYLHSKQKSDFYFSLPTKRYKRYVLGMVMCGIIFTVPCVISYIGKFAIAAGHAIAMKSIACNLIWQFLCMNISFWINWSMMTCAMILTGNTPIAGCVYGATIIYIPYIIKNLIPAFEKIFYITYAEVAAKSEVWEYFSPFTLMWGIVKNDTGWKVSDHITYLFISMAVVVFLCAASLFLYQRRPVEAADWAIAFPKWNPVISVCAVVPLGLWSGEIIYEMAPTNRKIWLFVGTIFSIVLIHGIVESIFELDFRAMFKRRRQLVFSLCVAGIFLGIIYGNTNRYNSYVAAENEVEQITMTLNCGKVHFYRNSGESRYVEKERVGISGKEIRPILSFAGELVKQQDYITEINHEENSKKIGSTTIEYKLKNGKRVARYYEFDLENETSIAMLDMIVGSEAFKDDFYVFYSIDPKEITTIDITNGFETKAFEMSDQERKKFVEAYLDDFSKLTYTEILDQQRIGKIYFSTSELWNLELCIYNNFSSTLEFLRKHDAGELMDDEMQLQELEICDPNNSIVEFTVTDKNYLTDLKNEILFDDFYYADEYIYGSKNTRMAYAKIFRNGNIESKTVWLKEELVDQLKN